MKELAFLQIPVSFIKLFLLESFNAKNEIIK